MQVRKRVQLPLGDDVIIQTAINVKGEIEFSAGIPKEALKCLEELRHQMGNYTVLLYRYM